MMHTEALMLVLCFYSPLPYECNSVFTLHYTTHNFLEVSGGGVLFVAVHND